MRLKLLFPVCLVLIYSCAFKNEVADTIIHNAQIHALDGTMGTYDAMAIRDGRIIEIGPERQILNKYKSENVVDIQKQHVYPGLIDGHCHFLGYGLGLQEVDLAGTKSWDDVMVRIEKHQKDYPSEWIIGRGWDQNDWEEQVFPSRFMIDSVYANVPVVLSRIDGHAALINSEAMRRAGITGNEQVLGGELIQEQGAFTGMLIDNAIDLVRKVMPQRTREDKIRALKEAEANCLAVGLTTVDDAGLDKSDVELIDELQKSGELKMRIYAMLSDTEENKDHFLKTGPYITDRLSVRAFKFYSDGALGSRGAFLIEPYSDREDGHSGFLLNTTEYFQDAAQIMYDAGFQMNTHCIGDKANRELLHIYASVLGGANDRRWRIEHAQIVDRADIYLFGENSVIPSIQPTHATSDMYWAEFRLGRNRIRRAYAWKELREQLGMVALGTDFPVEGINPLATFYAAVVRKDAKGYPSGGFQPENALTREEALNGMTLWAAVSNFEEEQKGTIEVGKVADFVVLDRDLLVVSDEEILQTKVMQTWIGGEMLYQNRE